MPALQPLPAIPEQRGLAGAPGGRSTQPAADRQLPAPGCEGSDAPEEVRSHVRDEDMVRGAREADLARERCRVLLWPDCPHSVRL